MNKVDRKRGSANIRVPVGAAAIWAAVLQVADENSGNFSATAVDAACDQPLAVVQDYLLRLRRAKIIERIGRIGGVYALRARPKTPPQRNPEQQYLWNAMRTLKAFTLNEVCYAAAAGTQKIPKPFARRYLQRLVDAGFLTPGKPTGADAELVYRLKPGMNTGPSAPLVIKMVAVFDPNMSCVHEEVVAEEVAA